MSTFVNNDVNTGDVVEASDHNTQGALLAAVLNGGIDNANIASGAAISGSKLADGSVTNAKLATGAGEPGGAWESWTPTWAGGMTIGNAVVTARYKVIGKTVFFHIEVTGGTTTSCAGGAVPTYTLPVTSASRGVQFPMGQFVLRGTVVGQGYTRFSSTTVGDLAAYQVSGTTIVDAGIHEAFGNGDRILLNGTYEAA